MTDSGEQPTTQPEGAPLAPPPPGAMPYGSPLPGYGQQPPPYYPHPGYPTYPQPAYFAPAPMQYGYPQDHPQAGLALGLGLGAIIGGFFTLGLAFALGPFAWFVGQRARTQIKKSNGFYHAEGNATAGMVLGIISTVLLVLAILFWMLVIIGAATGESSNGSVATLSLMVS
ncbi:MAG TPA: DUF4190 domain-containing protein [Marmoricola sp.]|nr:DUF4190 domain-containing protein [Marmoricola sp.]